MILPLVPDLGSRQDERYPVRSLDGVVVGEIRLAVGLYESVLSYDEMRVLEAGHFVSQFLLADTAVSEQREWLGHSLQAPSLRPLTRHIVLTRPHWISRRHLITASDGYVRDRVYS